DGAGERLDPRPYGRDTLGRENGIDQRTIARMPRRVDLDRQLRFGAWGDYGYRGDAGDARRVVAPVDGGSAHVLIACHQPETAVLVRARERTLAMQPLEYRERIGHEGGIVDIDLVLH